MSAYGLFLTPQLQKQKIYGDTFLLAQQVSAELERELSAIESGLRAGNVGVVAEVAISGAFIGWRRMR